MQNPTAFVATCDLSAIVRGRAVPDARLSSTLETGVGWVPADLALTCLGSIAPDNVFGSVGDLRLLPDPTSYVDIPTSDDVPGTRLYLADQTELDGTPWSACPRTALKDAVTALEEGTGLSVRASFEHEFIIEELRGAAPFSFERARRAEPFGSELVTALEEAGLEPESWLPEYGEGQFEITIRPTDALRAADRAILLREIVRDLARRKGMHATFAPIPDPQGVGNGVHIHLSLYDPSGLPVMYDIDRPGRLSEIATKFSAGIVRHAFAVLAITAPSPVSYLRLTPHRWSSGGVFLAERNREAMLRICPTIQFGGRDQASQLHLEFRAADATANPWLALAALIRAGLQGIMNDYEPEYAWPESATEEDLAGVPRLPKDLCEALDGLESDEAAAGWFGERLLETFIAVKREEIAATAHLEPSGACSLIASVY